jgi:hypothetical protein
MSLTDVNPTDVEAAISRVRSYCDWHLAPAFAETVEVDGANGRWRLNSLKITAVASVTDIDTGLVVADIKFERGRVWSTASRASRTVLINFTHGYTVCPPDVVEFVRQLAKSGPVSPPISQATVGTVNVSYREPSFAALNDYRLPQIA